MFDHPLNEPLCSIKGQLHGKVKREGGMGEGGWGMCHSNEDIAAVTIETFSSMMCVGPKS